MPLLAKPKTNINVLSDSNVQRILALQTPMLSGPDVRQVQSKLMKLGYPLPKFGADGIYGEETQMAVKAFQQDNKLSITGSVGPSTWKALAIDTGKSGLPAKVKQATQKAKDTWLGLSPAQQWMYGLGGSALLLSAAIAIKNR